YKDSLVEISKKRYEIGILTLSLNENEQKLISIKQKLTETNDLKKSINDALLALKIAEKISHDIEIVKNQLQDFECPCSLSDLEIENGKITINISENLKLMFGVEENKICMERKKTFIRNIYDQKSKLSEEIYELHKKLVFYSLSEFQNNSNYIDELESQLRILMDKHEENKNEIIQLHINIDGEKIKLGTIKIKLIQFNNNYDDLSDISDQTYEKLSEINKNIQFYKNSISETEKKIDIYQNDYKNALNIYQDLKKLIGNLTIYLKIENIQLNITKNNNKITESETKIHEITNMLDVKIELDKCIELKSQTNDKKSTIQGRLIEIEKQKQQFEDDLKSSLYVGSLEKYLRKLTESKILSKVVSDLDSYYNALD
ncbi:hypothetical protein MXB_2777, partial [Myxobolus squamalis]